MPFHAKEAIITLYDNAIAACHQVRQVHPFLLPALKFPADLHLSSVGLLEENVCQVRDRLRVAYEKSVIPLKAYAREYHKYLDIYNLDVAKYVE